MHALVVLAHPEQGSFTAALAQTAVTTLTAAGWTVDLDDLAREGFRRDVSREDFLPAPEGHVQVMYAQEAATVSNGYASDVADQIARLQRADLLITVSPFWWFSVSGLLKNWIDRVFANGVAYGPDPYNDGPLKGMRALAAIAVGGEAEMYGPDGSAGDIHALLNPLLRGTFGYCAMDVLEPFLVFEADGADAAVRERALAQFAARLTGIAGETPIRTEPLRHS